jgi:hypothetical protein
MSLKEDDTLLRLLMAYGEDVDITKCYPNWMEILEKLKEHPAASKHHSHYTGGLYVHTTVVVYYAAKLGQAMFRDMESRKRLVWLAFIHDFGKTRVYELNSKGNWQAIYGAVDHVYHTINMATSPLPEMVHQALVRHHGGWSLDNKGGFDPFTILLHAADMLACVVEDSIRTPAQFDSWKNQYVEYWLQHEMEFETREEK